MDSQQQKSDRYGERESVTACGIQQKSKQQGDHNPMKQHIAEMITDRIGEPPDAAVDRPGDIANQQRFFARKISDKNCFQIGREAGLSIELRMIFEDADVIIDRKSTRLNS